MIESSERAAPGYTVIIAVFLPDIHVCPSTVPAPAKCKQETAFPGVSQRKTAPILPVLRPLRPTQSSMSTSGRDGHSSHCQASEAGSWSPSSLWPLIHPPCSPLHAHQGDRKEQQRPWKPRLLAAGDLGGQHHLMTCAVACFLPSRAVVVPSPREETIHSEGRGPRA